MHKSISRSLDEWKRANQAEKVRWNNLLEQIAESVIAGHLSIREANNLTGIHRLTITRAVGRVVEKL